MKDEIMKSLVSFGLQDGFISDLPNSFDENQKTHEKKLTKTSGSSLINFDPEIKLIPKNRKRLIFSELTRSALQNKKAKELCNNPKIKLDEIVATMPGFIIDKLYKQIKKMEENSSFLWSYLLNYVSSYFDMERIFSDTNDENFGISHAGEWINCGNGISVPINIGERQEKIIDLVDTFADESYPLLSEESLPKDVGDIFMEFDEELTPGDMVYNRFLDRITNDDNVQQLFFSESPEEKRERLTIHHSVISFLKEMCKKHHIHDLEDMKNISSDMNFKGISIEKIMVYLIVCFEGYTNENWKYSLMKHKIFFDYRENSYSLAINPLLNISRKIKDYLVVSSAEDIAVLRFAGEVEMLSHKEYTSKFTNQEIYKMIVETLNYLFDAAETAKADGYLFATTSGGKHLKDVISSTRTRLIKIKNRYTDGKFSETDKSDALFLVRGLEEKMDKIHHVLIQKIKNECGELCITTNSSKLQTKKTAAQILETSNSEECEKIWDLSWLQKCSEEIEPEDIGSKMRNDPLLRMFYNMDAITNVKEFTFLVQEIASQHSSPKQRKNTTSAHELVTNLRAKMNYDHRDAYEETMRDVLLIFIFLEKALQKAKVQNMIKPIYDDHFGEVVNFFDLLKEIIH